MVASLATRQLVATPAGATAALLGRQRTLLFLSHQAPAPPQMSRAPARRRRAGRRVHCGDGGVTYSQGTTRSCCARDTAGLVWSAAATCGPCFALGPMASRVLFATCAWRGSFVSAGVHMSPPGANTIRSGPFTRAYIEPSSLDCLRPLRLECPSPRSNSKQQGHQRHRDGLRHGVAPQLLQRRLQPLACRRCG